MRKSTGISHVLANAPYLALFQYTQQFYLHVQRHFANFVKKQRSTIGCFKTSFSVFNRTGKRALAVAKELAFNQAFRNGSAVDGNERTLGTRAVEVNGAGKQVLTRSALSQYQNRTGLFCGTA